jgi:peptidoglycan/xylan/chitin deacetylase (PgdA/CDA1 family)
VKLSLKLLVLLTLIALCLSGCSAPFRKPLAEPNHLPPVETPVPGPSERNPSTDNHPGKFYRTGDSKEKKIALTFDDGPETNWTPRVLDILRDKQVKATFFVIGREADKYPDLVRRMVAEGHVVGNHTYHHVNLNNVPPEKMEEELRLGTDAIAKIANIRPRLLRPPFGAQNPKVVETANENGYFVILWSVDTEDWRGLDASTVRARVVPTAKNGDIILQHNGEGPDLNGSVNALPTIIDDLKARGYMLVTIPELLNIPAY